MIDVTEAGFDSTLEPAHAIRILGRPIDFLPEGTSFWCNRCDGGPVNSSDKNTGRFFSQFGHLWIPWDRKHMDIPGRLSEDYTQVIFAVCIDCIKRANKKYPARNSDE